MKEKYSPLPQKLVLMCLEQDTIPELLHLSCSENFVVLGSSQLSKCVAGSDFIHHLKNTQTHSHTKPQAHTQTTARTHGVVPFTLFLCMTLS